MSATTTSRAPPVGPATRRTVGAAALLQPVGVPWTARTPPVGVPRNPLPEPATVEAESKGQPDATTSSSPAIAVARFASLVYVFVVVFLVLATVIPAVLAGWQPLAVVSGSMQPALARGSLVLVQPADPDHSYAPPAIVAFDDPARPGQLLTHRVVDTTHEDGRVAYTTKGDANRVADSGVVAHDDVIGAVRMVVPFVGLPATWLHSGQVATLVLWLLASLLVAGALLVRPRP